MAAPKGHAPNKGCFGHGRSTPGRKNAPNKLAKSLRARIADLCEETFPHYEAKLREIDDPLKYCTLWHQLAEYAIPKLARIEHTGEGGGPVLVGVSTEDESI